MKLVKILAVVSLMFASTVYAGGYADLQYYQEENRNTNKENIKHAVTVGNKTDLGSLKPYIGVRLGEKIGSSSHFSHYAVDAGTKFPIAGSLTGDLGYRYRNAFETANLYQSNRYHVALAYALTKQDSLAVRYSQSYGDASEEKNSWRFTYSRSF